ncbi:MAG: DUF5723 family protein [Prevotellaceae bacterium]|nr:DUF5723 family protein [Prevotellaceae bacterium]
MLLLVGARAQAQADITLYHMQDLPLNNRLNPAFQPKNGSIYIAIPAIPLLFAPTSIDVSVTGKNITYGNLLSKTPNYKSIVDGIGNYGVGQFNFGYTPISFGFMVKDMYFSLDVNVKTHVEGRVPKDMASLIYYGNGDDKTLGKKLSMNGLGGTGYAYAEIALGFSKEIDPLNLIVGGKLKYLQGGAYAQANLGKDSYIQTDKDNYYITVGIDPEMYLAGLPGSVPSGAVALDSVANGVDFDLGSYKFNTGNRGFAFDIGGTWNVGNVVDQPWAKNLDVSASLIDVGFINWKGNKIVKAKDATPSITFEGMDMNGGKDFVNTLKDSIMSMTKVESAGDASFRKWLSPTLYFGANYHIFKYLNAGALFGCRFDTYENLPLVAASINTQNLGVNASLSASYFDSKGNLGFGILFGRRGCQFHIITDNILAAVSYKNAQSVNLRMGMNVLVGKTREKRKEIAAADKRQDAYEPSSTQPGEALNPVQQEGTTGDKVEGSNAPEAITNEATTSAAPTQAESNREDDNEDLSSITKKNDNPEQKVTKIPIKDDDE